MTDKKELKEEDIRNVNGGFRVIDPSEDKELKEEDLNKISGGAKKGDEKKKKCPYCNKEYFEKDLVHIDGCLCCPYCKKPLCNPVP